MHTLLTCYSGFSRDKYAQDASSILVCVLHLERTATHTHTIMHTAQVHMTVWLCKWQNGRIKGLNIHTRHTLTKKCQGSKAKKLISSRIMCDSVRLNTCSTSCKLMRIIETYSLLLSYCGGWKKEVRVPKLHQRHSQRELWRWVC